MTWAYTKMTLGFKLMGFKARQSTESHIPGSSAAYCVPLNMLCPFSVPQSPRLRNVGDASVSEIAVVVKNRA